jgi:thiamine-phosphate pyrophosphorylase
MMYHDQMATLRVIDANFDRASEGLRVVEEYARFIIDDTFLCAELKSIRHKLIKAIAFIPNSDLLAARETQQDVGTTVSTPSEYQRESLGDVLRANLQRVQQALRAIEEYGKTLDPQMAVEIESLRYRTYTLEKALVRTAGAQQRSQDARLYVLVDGRATLEAFDHLAKVLVESQVNVIQLRDKTLPDRALLERARRLRELTRGTSTMFIVNDRPDLAVLAQADGVHVGQDELSVHEVRKVVGPQMLIGVSTHTLEQARQAVLDGADYIGCGPTFPSSTKAFDAFAGLEFLRQVAAEISLPAFAIGGIDVENAEQVVSTGMQRIAVSGAVVNASEPAAVVAKLRSILAGSQPAPGNLGGKFASG